jgi:hypothetical protein
VLRYQPPRHCAGMANGQACFDLLTKVVADSFSPTCASKAVLTDLLHRGRRTADQPTCRPRGSLDPRNEPAAKGIAGVADSTTGSPLISGRVSRRKSASIVTGLW